MGLIAKALAWVQASAWWLGACLVLSSLAWVHGCHTGVDQERARDAANQVKVLGKAREADAAADAKGDTTRAEIEAGNERARDAAKNSDDPLGDALRELRREAGAGAPSR